MTEALPAPADTIAPPVHQFAPPTTTPTVDTAELVARVPRVFVALCTRDWQTEAHTAESVRNIGRVCRVEVIPRYMMNDGVARARNNLAADFLASDCDILFFLDNDIIIEPRHFDRLMSAVTDRGIVCALYPKKQPTLEWVVNWLPGEVADADGYMRVKHAGTGAMAITRERLLAFIEKHPEIEYSGDPSPDAKRWDLFPMHSTGPNSPGPQLERVREILAKPAAESVDAVELIRAALQPASGAGRYDSEDWAFCNKMRADGWDVWVDTRSQLRHIGKIVYPLQFTMTDEEVVDIVVHRYHIAPDLVRTFIASGSKTPGLMGGHREVGVRHWPKDFPVSDLHQGDVLAGCYDVPYFVEDGKPFEVIDIGADVGAFARWAAKRWPKCPIHCYEWRPGLMASLECTVAAIADKHGVKPTVYAGEVRARDVEGLPAARVIKIDAAGAEREIVEALAACARLSEFDCIMIKYYDELTAYFLKQIVNATHVTHCFQRFDESRGILKFLRREASPTAVGFIAEGLSAIAAQTP